MRVSVVQMNSQDDKAANLDVAERLVIEAAERDRPDLIVLPENFTYLGEGRDRIRASADRFPDGEAYRRLQELARRLGVAIHAGSMIEQDGDSFYNATVVFDGNGAELARYRKIHLFDVDTPGGLVYRESDAIGRGRDVVTYKIGDVSVGCAICYDLRFPELFRRLADAGAQVIVLPAAFTLQTGKDHWEVLIRARAIETQTWFVASAQIGTHAEGRKASFGHSMVVDPWGLVVSRSSDSVGSHSAQLDFAYQEEIRAKLPVSRHHVLG